MCKYIPDIINSTHYESYSGLEHTCLGMLTIFSRRKYHPLQVNNVLDNTVSQPVLSSDIVNQKLSSLEGMEHIFGYST